MRGQGREIGGIAVGALAALAAFAVLGAAAGSLAWLLLAPSASSQRHMIGFIGAATALVAGSAAGGWVGARVAGARGPAAGTVVGLVTATAALLVVVVVAWQLASTFADFYSVRLALGLVEVPAGNLVRPDVPLTPSTAAELAGPAIEPAELARRRTLDAATYLVVVLLAAAGAGVLGGIAGSAEPAAPPAGTPATGGRTPTRGRRPVLPNAGPVAVAVTVGATLLLSAVAAGDGVLPGDTAVARWLQGSGGPVAAILAHLADWTGSLPGLLAVASILVIVFLAGGRPWPAVLVVAAVLARSLNPRLKDLFDSPRPPEDLVRVTEQASHLGFPSGHSMGVTLLFGTVIALAEEGIERPWPRRLVQAGAAAVILMTGFGRVYTGAHWPSDVLGGYLWGTLTLLVLLRLRRAAARWHRPIGR